MQNERYKLNKELAQMLKGGVIMDVSNPEQAKIAEAAGAVAVMALERIPADIRAAGGVSRMSDPKMIKQIQDAVSIPVMAKVRLGHFVEAQILEAIEIDYIDESEVLSPADDVHHIDKTKFNVPFVCGAKNLGEALRRISEGASMIRTKGEPGTGDVIQAVRHMRAIQKEMRTIQAMDPDEVFILQKEMGVSLDLLQYVHKNGKLPVVNFAAGGIATPADAALMMQLGCDGVFVGSGIFKSGNPGNDGNYNTYKYEDRFFFRSIGDTEEFFPTSGSYENRTGTNAKQPFNHHDNFRHFGNRYFVDVGEGYTYNSFFGSDDATEDGRMVGRTLFFKSDGSGNITYPINHYFKVGTSKDGLTKLIYKGTQNDGSNPPQFDPELDVSPTIPAYAINVGGSDTTRKLKVIR